MSKYVYTRTRQFWLNLLKMYLIINGNLTVAEKDPKNKHSYCWQTYLLQNNLIDLQADINLYPTDQIGLWRRWENALYISYRIYLT